MYSRCWTKGIKHKPIVTGESIDTQKLVQGAQTMTGAAPLRPAVTQSSTLIL